MAGRIQSEFVGDYVPSHEPYNIFAESYVDGKNTAVDRPTVLASRTKILYPFIHLGGEEQMWDKFLAQGNSSGLGGIRTRDLSIPTPASYL
ncbi:hypothetical protein DPMN_177889 [Dreissena polymorpha]|uniref:Uncharacterized protein n=1 Tax=Dreissena polymorpha TaxID=45954 RepID=A0A9D4IKM3_DREPO|nr:hypothetical protein DPMN_177889 [Dreissena polymorpha]